MIGLSHGFISASRLSWGRAIVPPNDFFIWALLFTTSVELVMPVPRLAPFAAACALTCALFAPAAAATWSIGPGGDYPSITAAFAAPRSEASVFELLPGYTSVGETFPISLYGSHPITIRPQLGATGLVISGSITPLVLGFGGGFVVDGRPGGVGTSRELTIRCTSTSAPAVQFTEGSHDTLRWVNVESANASATSGAVYFAPNQLGCAFDHVSACRIGGGGLVPSNLVYFPAGNVSSRVRDTAVEDCELRDWFGSASVTAAICVQTESRDLAFRRNTFHQSAARSIATAGRTQFAILVNGPTPNLTIEDNWFGGSAPQCAGTPWTLTGSGAFTLVSLTADNAAPTIVRGNVVRNFDVTVGGTARFFSLAGNVRCERNAIGDTLAAGKIAVHAGTGATTIVSLSSADQSVVRDNRIAGVSHTATSGAFGVLGVTSGSPAVTIANNMIGGSPAGAIVSNGLGACSALSLGGFAVGCRVDSNEVSHVSRTAASSAQPMYGVRVTGASASLTGNRVSRLSDAAATTAAAGAPTLAGVSIAYTGAAWLRLTRNVVHSLASTAVTSGTLVCGVSVDMATDPDAVLDGSFVHSLTSASADTTAGTIGLRLSSGAASVGPVKVTNSMVRVGIGPDSEDAVNAGFVVGAWSQGGVEWIGNSIFVGGVRSDPSAGSSRAFEVSAIGMTPRLRNNVLANERGDFAPGGRHAALSFPAPISGGFPSDYGLFWAPVGFAQGALVQTGATTYSSLTAWQATGQDGSSGQGAPMFVAPYGTAANVDLHVVHSSDLMPLEFDHGVFWIGWTTDFDGDARASATPDIGADEFDMDDNTGVGEGPARALALAPARPNPVRGACTFEFALDRAGSAALEVFDANGRRVRTLVRGTLEPGVHSVRWDRTDDDGAAVRPGTYFVRLAGPQGRESRRVIVLD